MDIKLSLYSQTNNRWSEIRTVLFGNVSHKFKWSSSFQIDNKSEILPLYFKEPTKLPASNHLKVVVGISGIGGACIGLNSHIKDNSGYYGKTVDGRNKDGQFVEQVKFKFGNIPNNIVPDVYFYV